MVLNGSVYGSTIYSGLNFDQYPSSSEYIGVEIIGPGIFDMVWYRNIEMSDDDIRQLDITTQYVWDDTTVLLANFNNNLDAGSVDSLSSPITGFDLDRRKTTESTFTRLAQLDANTTSFVDITAQPNVEYIYNIFAKNDTEISEPIQSDPFPSNFFNWILIDPETQVSYIFNLELVSNAFGNEINYRRYDGYNKYSPFSFGDRDFLTGTIEAIVISNPCQINGSDDVNQTVEFLNELRAFINNGKEKILKSRKGHVLRVVTIDPNTPIWLDQIGEQLYKYSFSFSEVGEVFENGS